MKVLMFGPSGAGKTYISYELRKMGILAYDADQIEGLSAWYNKYGQKVSKPKSAKEALDNEYSFVWSKKFLSDFLAKYADTDVFIFGGAGNIFKLFDLFDRIYFLKINSKIQKKRIQNSKDRNSQLDFLNDDIVMWGKWLEEEARKKNIPFIDATLSSKEIYSIISAEKETNQDN
jgi:adenylate kinase family enzyme